MSAAKLSRFFQKIRPYSLSKVKMSNSQSLPEMSEIIPSSREVEVFESSHPLLCPPVLQNIFSNFGLEDLKTCRSVCQRWNVISLLQMKNSSTTPVVRICLTDEKRLKEFLNMETGFSGFQHFKLTFSMESVPILSQFMLNMNQFKYKIIDVTFVVGKNNGDDEVNTNMVAKFLSFLAANSSQWDSFGIEITGESIKDAPSTPFESFQVNWSKLKSLVIKNVTEFPIFIPILEKAIELEKLVIVDGPPYSTYQPLLRNLIPTLMVFELIGFSYAGVNELIPAFTKLKKLRIGGLKLRNQLTIPCLPELCELSLNDIGWILFENMAVFPNLTFLDFGDYIVGEEEIKKYPNIFPNLKKLNIKCANNTKALAVWKYFKKIEELRVVCQSVNDCGFFGTSAAYSDSGYKYDPKRGEYNWSDIYLRSKEPDENMDKYFGIQSLCDLKRVTIVASKISNFFILCGLLKCKSLRSIQLVSPSPYLTKDILKWMADDLNLMYLSIDVSSENLDWRSSAEAMYFREKHPNCQLWFPYYATHCEQTWEKGFWLF